MFTALDFLVMTVGALPRRVRPLFLTARTVAAAGNSWLLLSFLERTTSPIFRDRRQLDPSRRLGR